ncbi:MAG: ATP synthase F1 subunit gamma, partial [Prevotella sp.]|nr:ATP synthase F1 subunit gamma [Prevotella sp.]
QNMLPYETLLEHILKSFLAAEAEAQTIYDQERPVKRVALVVFSSNSSLCGGFNANIIKMMTNAYNGLAAEIGAENIEVYPIGRKVSEKATKLGYKVKGDYADMVDHPTVGPCIELAKELGERFAKGEVDKVELIYHHFKSAGSQILTHKTFLPIDIETELQRDHERDLTTNIATKKAQEYLKKNRREREHQEEETKPLNDNFIVEPDMDTVLSQLIPKLAHLMLYTALLDSVASEHAARMVAMQTATDNADELLRQLNLQYNKSRQQAITSELLDIVGGSVNN